jgi:hypothetical protein
MGEMQVVSITEVTIISIDKGGDYWEIEGEVLFETDLPSPFSAVYYFEDDEFESVELEINPGAYDKKLLKRMILAAADEYED